MLAGTRFVAVAFAEPGRRYESDAVSARAAAGQISGAKTFVLGAPLADLFLVTAAGHRLAKLDATCGGRRAATLSRHRRIACGNARLCTMSPAEALDLPEARYQRVIGDVRLLAAAEMLGLAQSMFDDTLAYVGERQQFGAAIGSFQALQHRLVECYAALEQARSMVLRTAMLDPTTDDARWPRIAAGAKAYVGEAATRIGLEAVQMHGGMGQTDELAIGHALKRVMLLDKYFGDQAHCLRSYARAA
jgi:alkylation response protein AidB-like acyl-CoA dehydrogenase